MITAVALIGKTNNPLFLHVYADVPDKLKFHYIVHTSLDVIEEKENAPPPRGDQYLGLLYPIEDYKLYGYVTSTNIKFVLVLDDIDTKDETYIKAAFRRLHTMYSDCVSNPFYTTGSRIQSRRFEQGLESMVTNWNTT